MLSSAPPSPWGRIFRKQNDDERAAETGYTRARVSVVTVSISCDACSGNIGVGARACPTCGRALSQSDLRALEERFEATNTDYREAKGVVSRSLTIALVAGLLTLAVAAVRLVGAFTMDLGVEGGSVSVVALFDLLVGLVLVACSLAGKHLTARALTVAIAVWLGALVLPFVFGPAQAILHFASPRGVAVALARIAVLIALFRGIQAANAMARLFASGTG